MRCVNLQGTFYAYFNFYLWCCNNNIIFYTYKKKTLFVCCYSWKCYAWDCF